jgi:hypothetical protein
LCLCVELGVTLTAVLGLVFVFRTGCQIESSAGPCVVAVRVGLGVRLRELCWALCCSYVCVELGVTLTAVLGLVL